MTTESLAGKAYNDVISTFFQMQKEEARGLFSPVLDQSSSSIYEGCSNMNASSFITFFTYIFYDTMVNVSIKDYMSPLNWHQP